jgi:hypothetical protein
MNQSNILLTTRAVKPAFEETITELEGMSIIEKITHHIDWVLINQGIKADVSKITAIVEMPTPTDVLAVQRDHKPLENIFTKPLAKVPKRIQCMLMQL